MRVINFGSLNTDHIYPVERFVRPGETMLANAYRTLPGGKGLNQSIALARAGVEVYHAGAIGQDGGLLRDALVQAGVDVRHLRRVDAAGGHAVIQISAQGQNSILLYAGTNMLQNKAHLREVLSHFGAGDVLLLQNETNCVGEAMELAHARGLRIAFNAAPMSDAVAGYPLQLVDWLILNEHEGAALAGTVTTDTATTGTATTGTTTVGTTTVGTTQEEEILLALAARYPDTAILLTLGGSGCSYRDSRETIRFAAYAVPHVVDTTGAGDTFTAYFLRAVATGGAPREALRSASAASALAIQRLGASGAIPALQEVEAALREKLFGELRERGARPANP